VRGLLQGFAPLLGIALILGGAGLFIGFTGWGGLLFLLLLVFAIIVPITDRIFYGERADLNPLEGFFRKRTGEKAEEQPEEGEEVKSHGKRP
jgi:predicted PurR-regulated permease PerM